MECPYTSFDVAIHNVILLPKNKLKDAVEVFQEYSLGEFINFCTENGCHSELDGYTIYDFIVMFEDLEGTYWEEDIYKLNLYLDSVGITEAVFKKYAV